MRIRQERNGLIIIGHRGFRVGVHENTFEAFIRAFSLYLDYIEFDVQLSKDQIIYILHDNTFDRTMHTTGNIADMTAEEIDAITTEDGKFHVPRLTQILEYKTIHPEIKTKLMIELKGNFTGKLTANLIQQYQLEDEVVFSGRYLSELKAAHKICPSIPLCLNITKCKEFTVSDLMKCRSSQDFPVPFEMFSLKSNVMNSPDFITKCHQLQTHALCWNFLEYSDVEKIFKQMITWNIDGILIDNPQSVKIIRDILSESRDT